MELTLRFVYGPIHEAMHPLQKPVHGISLRSRPEVLVITRGQVLRSAGHFAQGFIHAWAYPGDCLLESSVAFLLTKPECR